MRDHQPGCKITQTGECTCLNTAELEILRTAKDKLDVNYTLLAHKYRQIKVALYLLLFWFLFAITFNAIFMYLLWFEGKIN